MATSKASVSAIKTKLFSIDKPESLQIRSPRLLFIVTTIVLLVFGLVMVYSASFVEGFTDPSIQDSRYFFRRQLLLVGVGLAVLMAAALLDYRAWNSWVSWIPWVITIVMLLFTLTVGNEELGGRRWVDLFGFNFQPSEFAKIALLMLGAMLLVRFHEGAKLKQITVLGALAIGLPIMLILMQPDLGTAFIALTGVIAIVWFGELPAKPVLAAVAFVVFVVAGMIRFTGFRMSRIDAWLDPAAYAQTWGYQIINSKYAFAEGGVSGVGLGMSHQKYLYLPQPQNDLIFPIIGEEFGFIGTVFMILLFMVFLYAAFRIARNAPDFYGRIVAGSAATLIGSQAFLNMYCTVNLLPITGNPLPFFSAGGTSMLATLILVGLILNVSFRSSTTTAQANDSARKRREKLLILEGGRVKEAPASEAAKGAKSTVTSSKSAQGSKSGLGSKGRVVDQVRNNNSGKRSKIEHISVAQTTSRSGSSSKGQGARSQGSQGSQSQTRLNPKANTSARERTRTQANTSARERIRTQTNTSARERTRTQTNTSARERTRTQTSSQASLQAQPVQTQGQAQLVNPLLKLSPARNRVNTQTKARSGAARR